MPTTLETTTGLSSMRLAALERQASTSAAFAAARRLPDGRIRLVYAGPSARDDAAQHFAALQRQGIGARLH